MVNIKSSRSSTQQPCHLSLPIWAVTLLTLSLDLSNQCLSYSFWSRRSRDHAGLRSRTQLRLVLSNTDAHGASKKLQSQAPRTVSAQLTMSTDPALLWSLWHSPLKWQDQRIIRRKSPSFHALSKTKSIKMDPLKKKSSSRSLCWENWTHSPCHLTCSKKSSKGKTQTSQCSKMSVKCLRHSSASSTWSTQICLSLTICAVAWSRCSYRESRIWESATGQD